MVKKIQELRNKTHKIQKINKQIRSLKSRRKKLLYELMEALPVSPGTEEENCRTCKVICAVRTHKYLNQLVCPYYEKMVTKTRKYDVNKYSKRLSDD